jgi:hypothetical protein
MSDKKFSVTAIINTISFFASCIKCGEKWDDVCQKALDDATDEIRAIRVTHSAPCESLDKQVVLGEAITALEKVRFWLDADTRECLKDGLLELRDIDLAIEKVDAEIARLDALLETAVLPATPKEAAGANTECDEGCGLCGGTGIFEEGRCPQILGLGIGESAGVSEERAVNALKELLAYAIRLRGEIDAKKRKNNTDWGIAGAAQDFRNRIEVYLESVSAPPSRVSVAENGRSADCNNGAMLNPSGEQGQPMESLGGLDKACAERPSREQVKTAENVD